MLEGRQERGERGEPPDGLGEMRRDSSARVSVRCLAAACIVLAAAASACASAGMPAPPPSGAALADAAIREGAYTAAEAEAVAGVILEAERLLGAGDAAGALDLAREAEVRYGTVPGSSRAVLLRAAALRDLGDFAEAEAAANSYVALVPDDPAAAGRGYLLRAEIRREGGLAGGVEALFDVPPDAGEAELARTEDLAAIWAPQLGSAELRDLTAEAPPHPRVLPVFLAELAVRRFLAGEEEAARAIAAEALDLSPGASAAARAMDVVNGTVPESVDVAGTIGAILPVFGSPAVSRIAREIAEGVEVAMAVEEGEFERPARLVSVDDAVGPDEVETAVMQFEGDGAAGVIGPLQESDLLAAARARATPIPLVSPTARLIPQGVSGVYSLNGIDPNAGAALAELVLSRGVGTAVVLHTDSPEMHEEFGWFSEAYRSGGGRIVRVITFPPGSTGFASQMRDVRELQPEGLVLILPPGDVELLAPQIAFYGVDGIPGIRIFGSQSWTSESVLQNVQARSTEGVFSVTSWAEAGAFGPGWQVFVQAYEEHFQQSLRSPTAALGYDAARLLLRAARAGAGDPAATAASLEAIVGHAGATGLISVVDGRIRRSFVPVRIENSSLVLLDP